MIVIAILLLVIFYSILLLALVVIDSIDELPLRSSWMTGFQAAGYRLSEDYIRNVREAIDIPFRRRIFFEYISKWTISKGGVDFMITPYLTGGERGRSSFMVNFVFPDEIRLGLRLMIWKRGIFEKRFRSDRVQFHHINRNLTILSSNVMIVKNLLSDRWKRYRLWDLLDKCGELDVGGTNTITTEQNLTALVQECDSILRFIEILLEEISTVIEDGRYDIDEILLDHTVELSCIICNQLVKIEEVLVTDCCSSVGHPDHIKGWLKSYNECPFCKKRGIVLLDPVKP